MCHGGLACVVALRRVVPRRVVPRRVVPRRVVPRRVSEEGGFGGGWFLRRMVRGRVCGCGL